MSVAALQHNPDSMADLGHKAEFETSGVLRESVMHRLAQYCIIVRGRLLIDQ